MSTSSPPTSYTISSLAYSLPILHAAKHTSASILGVFIGRSSPGSPSSVAITHAIPLLHSRITLSPMTETGLDLAAEYAKTKEMQLVGLYYAASEGKGTELGRVGEKVFATLKADFPGALAFVIDNSKLDGSRCPYVVYTASSPSAPTALPPASDFALLPGPFSLSSTSMPTRAIFEAIRERRIHRTLADLDDHLEDSGQDFLENKGAQAALKGVLP